jgi:hypothetical protein
MQTHKNINLPTSVTIIAVFVLSITSWNIIRAYGAITNWRVLNEFGANPVYILATACVWILTGLWLLRNILKRYHYAMRASLAVAGLYYLWYWCDRLFIQSSTAPNVLFSAVVSTVLLAIFSIILYIPATRAFFNKE